jgi:hypothetical protein
MKKKIKNYFPDILQLDDLGRLVLDDLTLTEKIRGSAGFYVQVAGWDLSCNTTCRCNPSCFNNLTCNLSCPEPPNVGCGNENC